MNHESTPKKFRYCQLTASIMLAGQFLSATPALAEQAEATITEHVTVIGQAASINKALREQQRSDSISSVIHADGVAQLPDDNAAEALQRIPGVSVERDQGEGRYVSVRGLGPDLNSVTINGGSLTAPEDDTRAVALDVLPSELVQSLSVVKSLTPDMDANSLGGTIEVRTLSAFDHKGSFSTLSAEANHDDNTSKTTPKISGAFTRKFSIGDGTENFGVAVAASWQERKFGSDNVEAAWDGDELEEVEHRDYTLTRERTGLGLNFDFRPDDVSSYYLRTLYSSFKDTETRLANVFEEDGGPLAVGVAGDWEGVREFKNRAETQEVHSVAFGGERLINAWTLNGQVGYSRAFQDTPNEISGAFVGDQEIYNGSFHNTRKPVLRLENLFYDAGEFELDEIEKAQQLTTDTEYNVKLDLARDWDWNGHASQLKFGGKLSRREKDNNVEVFIYDDFAGADTSLTAFSNGNVDSGLGRFGPDINTGALHGLTSGLNGDRDDEASRIEDYEVFEDINALYLMNSVDIGNWRVIAGVRYEDTAFEARGTGYDADADAFTAVNRSNDYNHLLPGLHTRYQLDDNTFIRGAWTNTVVRPNFEQLRPGFVIDDTEAEFGNPYLKPLEASNFDIGFEHYFGRTGLFSVYGFYKDIKNFVYETDVSGQITRLGDWSAFDEAVTYANGKSASIYGVELSWSQKFGHFLVGANLTLSQSEAKIDGYDEGDYVSRKVDLPRHSDTIANLMVGWENDKLSLRLAGNHKSGWLEEVNPLDDPEEDLYTDKQLFVDFSLGYHINEQLQLSFDAMNLTNEVYYSYAGNRRFNAQYEEYGPSYKLGLTWTGL